jgi:hypothetical protein
LPGGLRSGTCAHGCPWFYVLSRFIVDMLAPVGVFRIVDWLR